MHKTKAEDIREKMIRYRAKKDISQKELARRAGVSDRTINKVENGKTSTARTLMKIQMVIEEEGTQK